MTTPAKPDTIRILGGPFDGAEVTAAQPPHLHIKLTAPETNREHIYTLQK